ncbi:hypothetical protein L1987_33397 [Smallanthus sonchifolius]|uniref:Uncharacterized protein n=1 Tax=Smallanthus sonchifolius TaxID=185202 RepID=A0ACB9HQ80_9ASTR|nr:hypothetical protein L1987_33397 [Smallanthus sonchifolius]
MGLDAVVWWDRNENEWKVFDDRCPHRLAPLSEGRIDQWGRLQCVYHGWCFGGFGDCKLIPQAPLDGPPGESTQTPRGKIVFVFLCIPVSPGNSILILAALTNFWTRLFVFRWVDHMLQNLIIDSDLFLLRMRYWSHVVNCRSCNGAYKGFNALQISLQVFSVASMAIMVATKPWMISVVARNTLATAAILCFVGSKCY